MKQISQMRMNRSKHGGYWFTATGVNGRYHNGRHTIEVCSRYFEQFLDVPKDTTHIYVVFTDEKDPEAYNFKIGVPHDGTESWTGSTSPDWSDLTNFRGTLMTGIQQKLAEMYNRGYRYAHVEWNEEK